MNKENKKPLNGKLLGQLFITMFSLSACTFGGGFVIVSLMKKKVVEERRWLDEEEMLDITAIAQSSPGPIPVNASVILGYRLQGIAGSLVAVGGTILPPMILLSLIAVFYDWFRQNSVVNTALTVMRAGVAAVICDVVINLAKNVLGTKKPLYIALMAITFILGYFLNVSAMFIILGCLATGILCVVFDQRKKGRTDE
ncbi:MAG: chromate transporter [Acetatifactor sp.]|nr:chromate transporter [Acetatifactor sp.]